MDSVQKKARKENERWMLFAKEDERSLRRMDELQKATKEQETRKLMAVDYDCASNWVYMVRNNEFVKTAPEPAPADMYDQTIVHDHGHDLEPDGMTWSGKLMGMSKQANKREDELTKEKLAKWYFIREGEWRSGEDNRRIALNLLNEDDSENEMEEHWDNKPDMMRLGVVSEEPKVYDLLGGDGENTESGTVGRCFVSSKHLLSRATPVPYTGEITEEIDQLLKAELTRMKAAGIAMSEKEHDDFEHKFINEALKRLRSGVDNRPHARVFFSREMVDEKEAEKAKEPQRNLRSAGQQENPYGARNPYFCNAFPAKDEKGQPRQLPPRAKSPTGRQKQTAASLRVLLLQLKHLLDSTEKAERAEQAKRSMGASSTRKWKFLDLMHWIRRMSVTSPVLNPEVRGKMWSGTSQAIEDFKQVARNTPCSSAASSKSAGSTSSQKRKAERQAAAAKRRKLNDSSVLTEEKLETHEKAEEVMQSSSWNLFAISSELMEKDDGVSEEHERIQQIIFLSVGEWRQEGEKVHGPMAQVLHVMSKKEQEQLLDKLRDWKKKSAGLWGKVAAQAKFPHMANCFNDIPWCPDQDGEVKDWGLTSFQVLVKDLPRSAKAMVTVPEEFKKAQEFPKVPSFLLQNYKSRYQENWAAYLKDELYRSPILRKTPERHMDKIALNMASNLNDLCAVMAHRDFKVQRGDPTIREQVMWRCVFLAKQFGGKLGRKTLNRFQAAVGLKDIDIVYDEEISGYVEKMRQLTCTEDPAPIQGTAPKQTQKEQTRKRVFQLQRSSVLGCHSSDSSDSDQD